MPGGRESHMDRRCPLRDFGHGDGWHATFDSGRSGGGQSSTSHFGRSQIRPNLSVFQVMGYASIYIYIYIYICIVLYVYSYFFDVVTYFFVQAQIRQGTLWMPLPFVFCVNVLALLDSSPWLRQVTPDP